jgi:hypothetical protein
MADRDPALAADSGLDNEPAGGSQGVVISVRDVSEGPPKLPI